MHVKAITTLRINMTGPAPAGETEGERYRAAIEMAAFADRHGFSIVNLEEHHCAEVGWLSSPLVLAGAVAARTERIRIRVCALLVTLYDPIRLAEDIAILDLASNGRVSVVAGQGYRPIEYHALDRDWARRGENTDFILQTLLQAWRGEPFEYRGRMVRVTPVPQTRPFPPLAYGGMSARRRGAPRASACPTTRRRICPSWSRSTSRNSRATATPATSTGRAREPAWCSSTRIPSVPGRRSGRACSRRRPSTAAGAARAWSGPSPPRT